MVYRKEYYKLLPVQFAETLVARGDIRITTLSACRSTEAGRGRVDPDENYKYRPIRLRKFRGISRHPGAPLEEARAEAEGYRRGSRPGEWIRDDLISQVDIGKNRFLYCVSKSTSRRSERQKYEGVPMAWVVIFNPSQFFSALDDEMRHRGFSLVGIDDVKYRHRMLKREEFTAADPAFIKAPVFTIEDETRAVWASPSKTLQPFTMDVPGFVGSCRILRKVMRPLSWDGGPPE